MHYAIMCVCEREGGGGGGGQIERGRDRKEGKSEGEISMCIDKLSTKIYPLTLASVPIQRRPLYFHVA